MVKAPATTTASNQVFLLKLIVQVRLLPSISGYSVSLRVSKTSGYYEGTLPGTRDGNNVVISENEPSSITDSTQILSDSLSTAGKVSFPACWQTYHILT